MGDGDRAGLLGVVDEVALGEVVGLLTDDLDRVLVGADRAVRAEAEEEAAEDVVAGDREVVVHRQRGVADVVDDADREVVLRFVGSEVVEDRLDHGGVELLRRQAVAAAHHHRVSGKRARAFGTGLVRGR